MPSRTNTDRRSSRERSRRRRLAISWAIAGVAGVLAVLADASPTGLPVADGVYRAAYAIGVTIACSQARRWTWPIVAGGALLGSVSGWWALPALAALVLAVTAQLDRRRRQPVGALVGALSAQALLRLPAMVAFGVPTVIAVLAPLPACVSAFGTMRHSSRRAAIGALVGVAGLGVVVTVGFGFGTLMIRSDAGQGASAARAGLRELRAGDEDAAIAHFAVAQAEFGEAERTAEAWWMTPAQIVPVLAQHLDAAQAIAAEGQTLAQVSADAAPAVALDELTDATGRIRMDRLAELEPMAQTVEAALEQSDERIEDISTDWLTGPMAATIDDLAAEVDDALPDARVAADALVAAPVLLGAETPRHYLVLFGNPAEARALGGFVASMGVLTADDGRLEFTAEEAPGALEGELAAVGATLDLDVPISVSGAQPERFVRNWTDSPDIATVTRIAADLYPQLPGRPQIDGVLYVDPYALAGVLELTGPVTIPETDVRIGADDAVDYLLRGQYLSDDFEAGAERKDRLADAGEIAFRRLTSDLPSPRRLAQVLSPLVQGRRLLFASTDESTHGVLERVGLMPPVATESSETLLVAHGNRRANKLDAYLERDIDYDVEVAADGRIRGTATIRLTNTAPAQGLSAYQRGPLDPSVPGSDTTNILTLDVLSRLDDQSITVDGEPASVNESDAYSLRQYSIPVEVPAGSTAVVVLELAGRIDPTKCELSVIPNAGSSTDTVSISTVVRDRRSVTERILDKPVTVPC